MSARKTAKEPQFLDVLLLCAPLRCATSGFGWSGCGNLAPEAGLGLLANAPPGLPSFGVSLPGKDSRKGAGWYFSRLLQAPSSPPLQNWRSPKLPVVQSYAPLVLVRGVRARPTCFGPQGRESFCTPAASCPPAPEKADRLAAALKRLWTLGRGSADSRAHYGLLVSGSAWPKVHSAGY